MSMRSLLNILLSSGIAHIISQYYIYQYYPHFTVTACF